MSVRPLIYPVTTLEPLRTPIGGSDASLVDLMVNGYIQLYGDGQSARIERISEIGHSFVRGELRGGKEPGEWQEAIHFLARGLGLLESEFPINEDWKWMAWNDYYERVAGELPVESRQLLGWLVEGRPLKARAIEDNGAYYAWLERQEIDRLLNALNALEEHDPTVKDTIDGFHNELIEWLGACRGSALLLVAA